MPDPNHEHEQTTLVDFVQQAVIANPNPPGVLVASQPNDANRPRIVGQAIGR